MIFLRYNTGMTQEDVVQHWFKSAQRNLEIAKDMVKLKHYDWALFLGQLALEKLLKGSIAKKTKKLPPFIHDLPKLAKLAGVNSNREQINDLIEITRFHVQARYEDIKYELYKTATKEYTERWFKKIEDFFLCFKKLY